MGLNIVFMGTPDFAVPPLKALVAAGHQITAVYTQPDRPKGRGKKLLPPPVKVVAEEMGIPVFQPDSMKTQEVHEKLSATNADVFVVVAYGHILPESILAIPRLGPVNIHASLLPRYRGAAPIQWAVANGEAETGVTTMFMDKGMDTGDMLLARAIPISDTDTAATMHDRLADLGADLIIETLEALMEERIRPVPQNHDAATYAPMLKKQDGHINWNTSAAAVDAKVRGMTPWPGAFAFHEEKRLKIFRMIPTGRNTDASPGTILEGPAGSLHVACKEGVVSILEIQGASGKRMEISAYLRGADLPAGSIFS